MPIEPQGDTEQRYNLYLLGNVGKQDDKILASR
jgi:hypothetical protein